MHPATLVRLLLTMTVVTGLLDGIGYLRLGHVFVANVTGSVLFFGFSFLAGEHISASGALVSIAAFLIGAVLGGRLRGDGSALIARATALEAVLVAGAALVAEVPMLATSAIVAVLACSMGMQNAVARKLAVPDLTTTVLTLTVTGIGADSSLAGGSNPRLARRIAAVLAMFVGAVAATVCVETVGVAAAVTLAACILGVTACLAYLQSRRLGAA